MPYGLTASGFVVKPSEIIQEELEAAFKLAFGDNLDVDPRSPAGQEIGIITERLSELWQLAEAVNAARDPDYAEGAALESISALTGTLKEEATRSTVTLTATGTNATVIPSGRLVEVSDTLEDFQTTESGTLATLTSWANTTAYVLNDRRTNATRVYQCITAGTSAGSGGPTTTSSDITDGTVHWRYLGEGAAACDIEAESVNTGPIAGLAGTITVITTPVAGWSSVTNFLDADLGRDEETDPDLRIRREDELGGNNTGPAEAIRESVLAVDGVTGCTVYENMDNVTDADGVPAYHMEIVVLGGDDAEIAQAIHESKSGGSALHGTTTENVEDAQGLTKVIKFTRPDEIEIYVIANVVKNPATYPSDGDDQIAALLLAAGNEYAAGRDVYSRALSAICFQVTGVLNVTTLYIGEAPAPASEAAISITSREIAVFDSARITVNSSNGTY
jgi:uncharacterized phage protein gp47/JayE